MCIVGTRYINASLFQSDTLRRTRARRPYSARVPTGSSTGDESNTEVMRGLSVAINVRNIANVMHL